MTAFVTKVIAPALDTMWPLRVSLPQDSDAAERWRRNWRLKDAQSTYEFNYRHVPALAVCDTVPITDQFSAEWVTACSEKVLVALENRALLENDTRASMGIQSRIEKFNVLRRKGRGGIRDLRGLVQEALAFGGQFGSPVASAKSLEEYSTLFRSVGLPPIAKDFQNDMGFADRRVAGPNPVMLQRVTARLDRMPISDADFQVAAPGDSFDAAMHEARLYVADYAILDGAETGSFPNGQKYLAAPIALFVVDKQTKLLTPVAIQCNQKPGSDNPIFTKNDGWNWMIAKTFVEIADGNIHEAMSHLGRTHLTMEPFVVTSLRQLAPNHPLSHLLRPHFEGTLSINKQSWQQLIADHGGVEKLFSASIDAARGLAAKSVQSVEVMKSQLPKTFAARGVDDASALPNYPYRDDSLLYWNAIQNWVTSYLQLYYHSDADVQWDFELQAWARELSSRNGGRINGLPNGGSIQLVSDLIDIVTFVIYTSSVQHAAVNFPQYDYMAYAPCMPLASYRPVPTTQNGATEEDYIAMLPTLNMAELQLELGFLLGGIRHTTLGEYGADQFKHDGRVAAIADQFRSNIAAAGGKIAARNRERQRPYTTLMPAGIPQSINI